MQCNITFCLFCESSNLFFLGVVVKLFDDFRKPNSLYSKFCVNCLFMFYFVYCTILLWKMLMEPVNETARWWPRACRKCVAGLRRLEKILNFLRCIHVIDSVLKYGSAINEGNWLQLLFCLIVLIGMVASVIGISFFSYVSGCGSKFSRIALLRKRLQLGSKSDLTTDGLILRFFVGKRLLSSTSYLYRLKSAGIAQLLFLWRHQIFSIFSLSGILVCSLKMLELFSHRIM